MKKIIFLLTILLLVSCSGPEARRPIQVKTGSFIKESAERNKQLLAAEEKLIQEIIKTDTAHNYHKIASGVQVDLVAFSSPYHDSVHR